MARLRGTAQHARTWSPSPSWDSALELGETHRADADGCWRSLFLIHLGSPCLLLLTAAWISVIFNDIHMYDKGVELDYHRVLTFTPTLEYQPNRQFSFRLRLIWSFFSLTHLSCAHYHPCITQNYFDIWYFNSNNPDERHFFSLIEKSCWSATAQTRKKENTVREFVITALMCC